VLICDICLLGYVSGRKKEIIPWAKLCQDASSWIKPECTPDGFQWADPSKIRINDVFRLLDHWRQRQEHQLEPLIWVSSCPLLQGVEQPSEHNRGRRRRQDHHFSLTDDEGSEGSSDSSSFDGKSDNEAGANSEDSTDPRSNNRADPKSDENTSMHGEQEDADMTSPPHASTFLHEYLGMIILFSDLLTQHMHHTGSYESGRIYTPQFRDTPDTQRRSTPGELLVYLC
jgi:hypothetical protein